MKRALFGSVRVLPFATGDVIDRQGMLSGVLGVSIPEITGSPESVSVNITATHGDTVDGTLAEINADASPMFWLGNPLVIKLDGKTALQYNIPMDFLGCKRYVKLAVAMAFNGGTDPAGTPAYALALGDPDYMPV